MDDELRTVPMNPEAGSAPVVAPKRDELCIRYVNGEGVVVSWDNNVAFLADLENEALPEGTEDYKVTVFCPGCNDGSFMKQQGKLNVDGVSIGRRHQHRRPRLSTMPACLFPGICVITEGDRKVYWKIVSEKSDKWEALAPKKGMTPKEVFTFHFEDFLTILPEKLLVSSKKDPTA